MNYDPPANLLEGKVVLITGAGDAPMDLAKVTEAEVRQLAEVINKNYGKTFTSAWLSAN